MTRPPATRTSVPESSPWPEARAANARRRRNRLTSMDARKLKRREDGTDPAPPRKGAPGQSGPGRLRGEVASDVDHHVHRPAREGAREHGEVVRGGNGRGEGNDGSVAERRLTRVV